MLSKEEQAEKYADIEHYVNCGTSRYQGFLAGYTARDEEDGWVSVDELKQIIEHLKGQIDQSADRYYFGMNWIQGKNSGLRTALSLLDKFDLPNPPSKPIEK